MGLLAWWVSTPSLWREAGSVCTAGGTLCGILMAVLMWQDSCQDGPMARPLNWQFFYSYVPQNPSGQMIAWESRAHIEWPEIPFLVISLHVSRSLLDPTEPIKCPRHIFHGTFYPHQAFMAFQFDSPCFTCLIYIISKPRGRRNNVKRKMFIPPATTSLPKTNKQLLLHS